VNDFAPGELLYRRYRASDVKDNILLPSALKFPNRGQNTGQSVNRSRFSRPADALWTETERLDGLGVFQFPVSCLPNELICSNTGRRFTFFPKHVPVKKNYAHSEIWCDEIPSLNSGYVLPTEVVKKALRANIQKFSQPVIAPRI
jgi:hypothetical protein